MVSLDKEKEQQMIDMMYNEFLRIAKEFGATPEGCQFPAAVFLMFKMKDDSKATSVLGSVSTFDIIDAIEYIMSNHKKSVVVIPVE